MKIPPKITPDHNTSDTQATSFPLRRRSIGGDCLAMDRVVENNGRHEKDHLDQERPVEIVHVRVGREQQQPGKKHDHQAAQRPKPGVFGELRRSLAAHADAQQRKIDDGDGSDRQRKSDDMEALKSRKDELRRI